MPFRSVNGSGASYRGSSRMRLRLIEDWHRSWRWSSMRFLALGGAAQVALIGAPGRVLDHTPEWVLQSLSVLSLACVLLAAAGRVTVLEQPNEPKSPPPAE